MQYTMISSTLYATFYEECFTNFKQNLWKFKQLDILALLSKVFIEKLFEQCIDKVNNGFVLSIKCKCNLL